MTTFLDLTTDDTTDTIFKVAHKRRTALNKDIRGFGWMSTEVLLELFAIAAFDDCLVRPHSWFVSAPKQEIWSPMRELRAELGRRGHGPFGERTACWRAINQGADLADRIMGNAIRELEKEEEAEYEALAAA